MLPTTNEEMEWFKTMFVQLQKSMQVVALDLQAGRNTEAAQLVATSENLAASGVLLIEKRYLDPNAKAPL
jgi:hypothetical protein